MRNELAGNENTASSESTAESVDVGSASVAERAAAASTDRHLLETFASGAAHAINNPLAIVMFNLSMIRESLQRLAATSTERDDLQSMLTDAIGGAKRISEIVKEMSLMMRQPNGAGDTQCPNTAVLRALMAVTDNIQKVTYQLGATGQVRAPAGALEQAFTEILRNAHQAVRCASEITVTTRDEGDQVVVTVHDKGCGIAKNDLPHVFEPFFQSKPTSGGAGLGLTAAQHLVTAVGGSIGIESAPEVGTTVRVSLPIDAASASRLHS